MSAKQISQENEGIYNRTQRLLQYTEKQRKCLSEKNLKTFLKYNDDMIIHSISDNTRYKNLDHFGLLTKMLQKDWVDVTEEDLRALVAKIMIKHGENGKESGYTHILKISLKAIIRFAKLGSRSKPENGELDIIRFIKSKKIKDKLTREDLPTNGEIQRILAVCADFSRGKAMFAVHAEAGTRIGESSKYRENLVLKIISIQIKHNFLSFFYVSLWHYQRNLSIIYKKKKILHVSNNNTVNCINRSYGFGAIRTSGIYLSDIKCKPVHLDSNL